MQDRGAPVDYNDPYIQATHKMRKYNLGMKSVPLSPEILASYDCAVVVTDHSAYDPKFIVEHSQLVIDTRNLIKRGIDTMGKVKKA
jgi:UDP-N-acetyl-D-glucosamine dehydrogenase